MPLVNVTEGYHKKESAQTLRDKENDFLWHKFHGQNQNLPFFLAFFFLTVRIRRI